MVELLVKTEQPRAQLTPQDAAQPWCPLREGARRAGDPLGREVHQ